MVAKELQDGLREISMAGFGIVLICHSKEKASGFTDSEGNAITSVEPDLSKNIYTVCNALCDLIAYIGVEFNSDGRSQRWLYTRQTPTIFAGSRWAYLDEKIPFGYQELVDAISRAIEKQAQLDGATIVDHVELEVSTTRSFNEVMNEAKELWVQFLNKAKTEDEKEQRLGVLQDIVAHNFGQRDFKISQAVPSQQDLIEAAIDEIKEHL